MNYIKMSPLSGMVGYGGGSTGLTNTSAAIPERIGDRGLCMGGYRSSADTSDIEYINLANSTGNGTNFGDLNYNARWLNACAGSGYGFAVGGMNVGSPAEINNIDRVTIATTSNASDHGDLSSVSSWCGATSNGAKAFRCGGAHGGGGNYHDTIETWDCTNTAANATDFGDLSHITRYNENECDGSRAVSMGGYTSGGSSTNDIEHFDTSSAGNATDVRNLTTTHSEGFATGCDGTTVICMGGTHGTGDHGTMEYFTMQSNSDAAGFGNLSAPKIYTRGANNEVRLVQLGGYITSGAGTTSQSDVIAYGNLGNASDFGDLQSANGIERMGGCSGN